MNSYDPFRFSCRSSKKGSMRGKLFRLFQAFTLRHCPLWLVGVLNVQTEESLSGQPALHGNRLI